MPAISQDMMMLIDAVAASDLRRANAYARVVIANDTNARSRDGWRKRAMARLERSSEETPKPPAAIADMVVVEDCRDFPLGRFTEMPDHADVIGHVTRMASVSERLATMRIRHPNATLLHGESGCGKTTLARRIAHDMGVPLVYVSFANLISSHMGKTAHNLSEVFAWCETTPCVLMLDELDTISSIRDAASDGPDREMARVTVTIMQLLDTLPPHVTLLAATNRPDAVDPALSRRFAKRFPIGRPPTGDHVCRIVSDFLADCGLTCETTVLETARTALEDARANDAEMPTQSDVVSALIDAIVVHEVADLSPLDPVDVSFLLDMAPSDPME